MRPRSAPDLPALALALLLLSVSAALGQPTPAPVMDGRVLERAPVPVVPAQPLGPLTPGLFHDGNRIEVPAPDVQALLAEDAAASPTRVAVLLPLEFRTTNYGQWMPLPGGAWIWTLTVHAPGARGLAVRVQPRVPRDAVLTVYPAARPHEARSTASVPSLGSWGRASGAFVTQRFGTDELRLEYLVGPGLDHLGAQVQLSFGILWFYRGDAPDAVALGPPLACHLDVTCYPDWVNEKDSVAKMLMTYSDYSVTDCTGAILNRSPSDGTPMLLLARHCLGTGPYYEHTYATWGYETATCNGTPPDPSTLPRTYTVGLLAQHSGTDIALLALDWDLPGLVLSGWDATADWTDRDAATGIHHPAGSYKRISFGTQTGHVYSPDNGFSTWRVGFDTDGGKGTTEGGSSGSPVFDSVHRLRGPLSEGTDPPTCSSDTNAYYGRLTEAWSGVLEPFLNGTSPMYVNGSYTGTTEKGTETEPFKKALKGVYAVAEHGTVYFETGCYEEHFTMPKAMTLRARNGTVRIGVCVRE